MSSTAPDAASVCASVTSMLSAALGRRLSLAKDNALPEQVLMAVSDIYVGIAERITGKPLAVSTNPKAEIIEVLGQQFGLID